MPATKRKTSKPEVSGWVIEAVILTMVAVWAIMTIADVVIAEFNSAVLQVPILGAIGTLVGVRLVGGDG